MHKNIILGKISEFVAIDAYFVNLLHDFVLSISNPTTKQNTYSTFNNV